jgi:hypothetical protein
MKDRLLKKNQWIITMVFAIIALNVASFAQIVTINSNSGSSLIAPATFELTATPNTSVQKVVFYRNDVPFFTDSTSPYKLSQVNLGQEKYTYRARAYTSPTAFVDSPNIGVTVRTPRVIRMGDTIQPSQSTPPSPIPTPMGPNRAYNHTNYIKHAIQYLKDTGGGTLFFPCSGGTYYGQPDLSIYNISETIVIPSNVTLQGESAEQGIIASPCRIYWNDSVEPDNIGCTTWSSNDPLGDKAMFQTEESATGVRFRDLWMVSRIPGRDCTSPLVPAEIEADKTTAILMDAGVSGKISDVIFENVSMTAFTYGIKAIGNSVSDVRMRGLRPVANHRQLSIDAKYAFDWDVQNFNIGSMEADQGGVEIIHSGTPTPYNGENGKLKFLQLNCNGNFDRTAAFCVQIQKHEGLYFKQLHHEGVTRALTVLDILETNDKPIVLEGSVATGKFYDDSMKLYLIGNSVFSSPENPLANDDNGRLEFFGNGRQATLVDCGDLHWDRTDTVPSTPASWGDWKMQYTHSERNRSSFFVPVISGLYPDPVNPYILDMPHKVCPATDPDTSQIGGEFFDTGVLPVEPTVYLGSQIFSPSNCNSNDCSSQLQGFIDNIYNKSTLVIKGAINIKNTVEIKKGRQIVGIPNGVISPQINFAPTSAIPLFLINAPITALGPPPTSGITIRDLKIVQTNSVAGTFGIRIAGESNSNSNLVGELTDVHLSGLTIQGFGTGFFAGQNGSYVPPITYGASPMLDGVSLKNFNFINNQTSVRLDSQNLSNWNISNISMESNSENAEGWDQKSGGSSLQNVSCKGSASLDMKDCVRLETAHLALTGLKKSQFVKNVVTIREGSELFGGTPYKSFLTSHLLMRHSDLRTKDERYSLNLLGKAFIVSMSNKYANHSTEGIPFYEGNLSRVTSCGDIGGTFSTLQTLAHNNYVGLETPTLMTCGSNPIAWEEPIKWGKDGDIPLVGNFFDDVKEDHVVYRPTTAPFCEANSAFYIREAQGVQIKEKSFGCAGDKPLVGRFFANTMKSQIAIYRPSNGQWWMLDPNNDSSQMVTFGLSTDIPIVGNFFSEGLNPNDQRDEIAIFRPNDLSFWIMNPRTGYNETHYRYTYPGNHCNNTDPANPCNNVQVGDFQNLGYEQVAHFKEGDWYILNLDSGVESLLTFGVSGDTPVAGKYFNEGCTQLGVWSPTTQEFKAKDPQANCSSVGVVRTGQVKWGLTYGNSDPDDIPLVMNGKNGIARPTALRRINKDPIFEYFITKHRWWVHDPIVQDP